MISSEVAVAEIIVTIKDGFDASVFAAEVLRGRLFFYF
jgi:hypothetical protein